MKKIIIVIMFIISLIIFVVFLNNITSLDHIVSDDIDIQKITKRNTNTLIVMIMMKIKTYL